MASAQPDWDELFMSAALEPERWLEALEVMASQMGASHGQLIGVGAARDIPFNIVSGFAVEKLQVFDADFASRPQLNFRIAAAQRQIARGFYDTVLFERHYDAEVPTLESRDYVEWCEAAGIPFGCQTNLVIDDSGLIGFAALNSRRDGRTTPQGRRIFAEAAAAARRAVRLQERLEGEQVRLLSGAFETIGICAFILDGRGRLLAHTARADELLSQGDIRLSAGALSAPGRPMGLGPAIRAMLAQEELSNLRIAIDRPDRPLPLVVEGFRLPERPWSFGKAPRIILIANAPRRDRAGTSQLLGALYRLTPAESDIAIRLVSGSTRSEIAEARGVSVETLRGQIKAIYAKCGMENEAMLVRLLSGLVQ